MNKYTKAMEGFAPTDEDKKKMEEQVQNKKSAENKDGDKKDGKVAEPTNPTQETKSNIKYGLKMQEPIHKYSLPLLQWNLKSSYVIN